MKEARKGRNRDLTFAWVPSICQELRELFDVYCTHNSHNNSVRSKPKSSTILIPTELRFKLRNWFRLRK